MMRFRQETVVDEVILFQRQAWIAPFKLAGGVAQHPVPQGQILRPRRCADGVCLHKPQLPDGTHQGGRLEQRPGDGVAAEVVKGERHLEENRGSLPIEQQPSQSDHIDLVTDCNTLITKSEQALARSNQGSL